jgi:hypothetical protein
MLVSSFLTGTDSKHACLWIFLPTTEVSLHIQLFLSFLYSVTSLKNKMEQVSAFEKEFVGN